MSENEATMETEGFAVTEIPVKFSCGIKEDGTVTEIIHKHFFPSALVAEAKPGSLLDRESDFTKAFDAIMRPIMTAHHSEVYAAVRDKCNFCGEPKAQVQITSISQLHQAEPHVLVMTFPVCFLRNCNFLVQYQVNRVVAEVEAQDIRNALILDREFRNKKNFLPCDVCGQEEDTLRCGRCGDAFYCGKEHQKMDWARHKLDCRPNLPRKALEWAAWAAED